MAGLGFTQPPTLPGLTAAESAGYGRAKERTGQATSAALKGLREQLAARGLSGSGIDAAETSKVFSQGLANLGEEDRSLAEQSQQQSFQATEADKSRQFSAAQDALRSAMAMPDVSSRTPGQPWNPNNPAARRQQAIDEAKRQLQALSGYSMPSSAVY